MKTYHSQSTMFATGYSDKESMTTSWWLESFLIKGSEKCYVGNKQDTFIIPFSQRQGWEKKQWRFLSWQSNSVSHFRHMTGDICTDHKPSLEWAFLHSTASKLQLQGIADLLDPFGNFFSMPWKAWHSLHPEIITLQKLLLHVEPL